MKKYVLILSLLFFFNPSYSFSDNHHYDEMYNKKYSRLEIALQNYLKWVNTVNYTITFYDSFNKKDINFEIDKYYTKRCYLNYIPLILECNLWQKRIPLDKEDDLGMKRISQYFAKQVIAYLAGHYTNKDRILGQYLYHPNTYEKSPKNIRKKIRDRMKSYSAFINKNIKVFFNIQNKRDYAASTNHLFTGTQNTEYQCNIEYTIFPLKESIPLMDLKYPYFTKSQYKENCKFN